MVDNKLNKNDIVDKKFLITDTDKKIDHRIVEKLENDIEVLTKLHTNIFNSFLSFKKDFDEFLLESASYIAKSLTESKNISIAGLPNRIMRKLIKSKPKGKVILFVNPYDYSFLKDFELDFKSAIQPFQELNIICDESIRAGDYKIQADNFEFIDSFDNSLQKLIDLLKNSKSTINHSSIYEFDNKKIISEKLNNLKYLSGFDLLNEIDSDIIASIIGNEDALLIAAILSRLPDEKSFKILSYLQSDKRNETCDKLKEINNIPSDIIDKVERIIYRLFESKLYEEYITNDGINYLTEVIKDKNNFYSKVLFKNLKKDYPSLFSKILSNDEGFEELVNVDDKGIQKLIKKVKRSDLVAALINAPNNILNKFLTNMSSGAIELFYEELNLLRDITEQEILHKRKKIYKIAKEMEEKGELSFDNNDQKF